MFVLDNLMIFPGRPKVREWGISRHARAILPAKLVKASRRDENYIYGADIP